jgi:uncharacterized protein YyaL (SSP411 family)
MYLLTANAEYERNAIDTMRPLLPALGRAPSAFGRMLSALDFYLGGPAEVALVGYFDRDDLKALVRAVWQPYAPNKVVAACEPGDLQAPQEVPLLEGRTSIRGKATAYVCRNYICQAPATDPEEVIRELAGRDEGIDV